MAKLWPNPTALHMSWFDSLAASFIPLIPKSIMRRLSTRYIAGEKRADALERGHRLARAGYRVTYDQLGEAVTNEAEVAAAVEENLRLLDDLKNGNLELNISTKPTQMGLNISEQLCHDSMAKVLEKAQEYGAFVRFEMEESFTVDGTLRVFEKLRAKFGSSVGVVLQSMLFRTEEDARALIASSDRPLNVRMVKGIYLEPDDVAYQEGSRVNDSYLRTLRVLLEGGAYVAAATHDDLLVAGLEQLLAENPSWRDKTEVQVLLGVREEMRQHVRDSGLPVRVYVPYGEAWHKYVTRRLKRNPKLARHAFFGIFKRGERLN
ncbi:MAG: proline dehydrogenase family protein [Planctomycetota bacterium]|nr:proline dehydrogenase family protein [Planctomycetota bacterium]